MSGANLGSWEVQAGIMQDSQAIQNFSSFGEKWVRAQDALAHQIKHLYLRSKSKLNQVKRRGRDSLITGRGNLCTVIERRELYQCREMASSALVCMNFMKLSYNL